MGKYVFHWEKWYFEPTVNSVHTTVFLASGKGFEYSYWLFDLLPKQTTCEMKVLQVQVFIQHWFYDEQRAKFM